RLSPLHPPPPPLPSPPSLHDALPISARPPADRPVRPPHRRTCLFGTVPASSSHTPSVVLHCQSIHSEGPQQIRGGLDSLEAFGQELSRTLERFVHRQSDDAEVSG